MKILLVAVNAKYIHSNLAVYSLKAYAQKYADRIGMIELTINHSEEDILKEIYREKADIVAFSCYIWNISLIRRVSEEMKKVMSGVKIWFGGPEVSYDAERCLEENDQLDGIVIGEGEQTFLELAEYYLEGSKELKEIAGIAFKQSAFRNPEQPGAELSGIAVTDITVTGDRQQLDMDSIPFPYGDMKLFKNRIIYYESSRGCPFSCSYCLSSIDKSLRFRSLELVKQELKVFLDAQIPQVKFVDRTFNCNKKHAMEIWSFIKENDNGITNFHFEISADLLTEEELDFLAGLRQGQIQFEIGVQTTNPDTIGAIHRRMDLTKLSRNVNRIRESRNIHQHLDLIAGLPLEGYSSFEKSFDDVYRLKPDQLQLGFLKVLKGSFMESEAETYGITFRSSPPYEVLSTEELSYDELLLIKGICEMVEIYYNSGQFTYTISYLEHFYPSPVKLYRAVSDYYENSGLALMAHSRIKRYEILLDFFTGCVIESKSAEEKAELTELFKEILIFDLYLREDLKSRPEFAPVKAKQSKLKLLYEEFQNNRKSIHIEQFRYDITASAAAGQAVKKATAILFDYENRDPLSGSASFEVLVI